MSTSPADSGEDTGAVPGTLSQGGSRSGRAQAPPLLFATGALLAVTIVLARLASDRDAPMLWFLTTVMGLAGLVLLVAARLSGHTAGAPRALALYSLGAGLFQALSTALAYLAVAHVGAGYISLVFAFPLLLTYALALLVGMDRFSSLRASAVVVALAGGLMLAWGKFTGLSASGGAVGWVLVASGIPFILAAGNLYRTRFWPTGAPPLLLAALMLLCAAALGVPMALLAEGPAAFARLCSTQAVLALTFANALAFALQFVAYFRLQQVAGPVYLSQIGSVAAAIGAPVAVLLLGETLPQRFAPALVLVVAGAVLFQLSTRRQSAGAPSA